MSMHTDRHSVTISTMSGKFFKLTMNDVPIEGKIVLVRADYNVPLNEDGGVADDYRIRMSAPTIKALLADKCKVVIISHLGRPEGERNLKYSLEPAATRLAELLGEPVRFVDDCIGEKARMAIKRAPKISVTVCENLRFYAGEEANDMDFARELAKASGAQYFVQDGFGVVHRAHASTSAITTLIPSVSGLLLKREYVTITSAMKHPVRPLVAVLGGAKVSDKISVIEELVDVADTIIIGGAMANTFLARRGIAIGKSKVETDQNEVIDAIYEKVVQKVGQERVDSFLILPVDVGVGSSTEPTATRQDVSVNAIPADTMALDLGVESTRLIESIVNRAHTVIWNGTLGYAEVPAFQTSSAALATVLAKNNKVIESIIGGGDTAVQDVAKQSGIETRQRGLAGAHVDIEINIHVEGFVAAAGQRLAELLLHRAVGALQLRDDRDQGRQIRAVGMEVALGGRLVGVGGRGGEGAVQLRAEDLAFELGDLDLARVHVGIEGGGEIEAAIAHARQLLAGRQGKGVEDLRHVAALDQQLAAGAGARRFDVAGAEFAADFGAETA